MTNRIAKLERSIEIMIIVSIFIWPLAIVPFVLSARLVTLDQVKSGTVGMVISVAILVLGFWLSFVLVS